MKQQINLKNYIIKICIAFETSYRKNFIEQKMPFLHKILIISDLKHKIQISITVFPYVTHLFRPF